jgi:hypothetical protein
VGSRDWIERFRERFTILWPFWEYVLLEKGRKHGITNSMRREHLLYNITMGKEKCTADRRTTVKIDQRVVLTRANWSNPLLNWS